MAYAHALTAAQRLRLGDVAELYQRPDLRAAPLDATLRFGLIADPQYADVEADVAANLFYRHALHKLPQAITALNQQPLDFVVTLGDLVDRHWSSYAALLPLYDRLVHPHAVVLGNHDAQTIAQQLDDALPLPKSYYAFQLAGWRFIVYDGNDISLYCNRHNGDDRQRAAALLAELQARQQPQAQPWNGAVGATQLAWLEAQLIEARTCGQQVIVFGHYPLAPCYSHSLLNSAQLAELFCRYGVRACFAGHDHRGGDHYQANTAFITLQGMLDGPARVPFAVVELTGETLRLQGWGGEISREQRNAAAPIVIRPD